MRQQTHAETRSWWIGQPPTGFTQYAEQCELPRMRLSREAAALDGVRMAALQEGAKKQPRIVTRWRES